MNLIKNFVFWTVAAVLCLPAVLGLLAGAIIAVGTALVGLVLLLVALAVGFVCCVPIIWWCALFEGMQVRAIMAKLPKQQPGN